MGRSWPRHLKLGGVRRATNQAGVVALQISQYHVVRDTFFFISSTTFLGIIPVNFNAFPSLPRRFLSPLPFLSQSLLRSSYFPVVLRLCFPSVSLLWVLRGAFLWVPPSPGLLVSCFSFADFYRSFLVISSLTGSSYLSPSVYLVRGAAAL